MPIVITSGDPAGIGPDIILQTAAQYELAAVVLMFLTSGQGS